jgi:hypothetical protein
MIKFNLPKSCIMGLSSIDGSNGKVEQTEYSSNLIFTKTALKRQKIEFEKLIGEMKGFDNPPLTQKEEEHKNKLIEHYRQLNEKEGTYVNTEFLIERQFSEESRFIKAFDEEYNCNYILICILVSTVVEALINTFIAQACIDRGVESVFEDFEYNSLLNKWLNTPKIFLNNYELDKGKEAFATLKELIKHRNCIVHGKSTVTINQEKLIDGKSVTRKTTDKEIPFLNKCLDLPDKLIVNLIKYMDEEQANKYLFSCGYYPEEIESLLNR